MSLVRRYVAVLVVALALPGLAYIIYTWRLEAIVQHPQLPVAFEHGDHRTVPCADCHHNFLDETGGGACYNCHKLTPEIAANMEATFHDFCRGCHVRTRGEGEDSGPLREFSLCHH